MKQLRLLLVLAALLLLPRTEAARAISVSELNYNPVAGSDYEFIELVNLGATPFDLSGASFTNGITYTFKAGVTLSAGARIVVCRTRSAFTTLYGSSGINLASGSYSGKLSDSGDTLVLVSAGGTQLLKFTYDSSGAWPSRANGLGSSLECIDPAGDLNDPLNWRSSTEYNGSPGRAGVGPLNTIVINEVLSHTDPPLEDAIELYNRAATNVDIGNWYLSNNRANPKKFHIPAGTVIPPHTFKVFYELRGTGSPAGFNPTGLGNDPDFTFNSAHGDEAALLSTTGGTNLQYWVDAVSFDAAPHGVSYGRYPDFTGPMVLMDHLTLGTSVDATYPPEFLSTFRQGTGASNALPKVGPLVFSRIMYHPLTNGDEFVELLNIATTNTPLFDPFAPTNTWQLGKAIGFVFPTNNYLAAGARLLVVATNPAAFRAKYGIPAAVQIFGPYTNSLDNAGETLELYRPDPPQEPPHPDAGFVPYILVEKVSYLPTAPWPVEADGTGAALLRKNPSLYGNDAANWTVDVLPPPVVSLTQLNATTVQLSFTAAPGRGYVVESATELSAAPTWKSLVVLDPTVNGSEVKLPVTITGALQFLRVR
jgi:hypothetical protein